MGHLRFVLLFAFGAAVSSCENESNTPNMVPSKLNVLVIVSDSLRPDHLGCYGYKRDTSPTIDALAREGCLFEHAYSHSSFTRESVAAILTGVPPAANPSGTGWYAVPDPGRLQLDGLFKAAGYATGFFSDHAIFADTPFGKDCTEREVILTAEKEKGASPDVAARVAKFIRQHRDKPFMAYVHFLDPHDPYQPAPEYYQRFSSTPYPKLLDMFHEVRPNLPALVAEGFGPGETRFEDIVTCYDAEIAAMDDGVRAVLDALRLNGELDNTLIVFSADHGEEFLDHGFVEHSWSLYEEVVHVPLIVWRPGLIPAGRETARVSHCDLFPTLANLAQIPCTRTDLYGSTIFDVKDGKAGFRAPSKPVFMHMLLETRLQIHAVTADNFKYIAAPHWLTPEGCSALSKTHYSILMDYKAGKIPPPPVWGPLEHEALYNLVADPGEKNDLSGSETATLEKMRQTLEAYRKQCPEKYFQGPPAMEAKGLSEEERERLEQLGYLGDKIGKTPDSKDAELERLESLGYLGVQ